MAQATSDTWWILWQQIIFAALSIYVRFLLSLFSATQWASLRNMILKRPTVGFSVSLWKYVYCRMTNYELLRWLVETPSRDVEHYRMFTASRSTVRQFSVWRQTLNCLTVTWRSLDIFYTVNVMHILRCFFLTFCLFCIAAISCRQFSHAAILWVKLSETPPSCRQNSHAAILVIRQNIYDTRTVVRGTWKLWRPSVKMSHSPSVTFSTLGRHISMSHQGLF